jgi:hypothetical protein
MFYYNVSVNNRAFHHGNGSPYSPYSTCIHRAILTERYQHADNPPATISSTLPEMSRRRACAVEPICRPGSLNEFIVGDLILAAVVPDTPVYKSAFEQSRSVSSVQKQAKEPKIYWMEFRGTFADENCLFWWKYNAHLFSASATTDLW